MELENFNRNQGEIEESSEQEEKQTKKAFKSLKDKDDLIKLQQQLEDANYLNNKLKKDRALLQSQKEHYEEENLMIKDRIKAEL